MAANAAMLQRTRHIWFYIKFLTQYIENGYFKIVHVKSEETLHYGLTKYVSGVIYEDHLDAFMSNKEDDFKELSGKGVRGH